MAINYNQGMNYLAGFNENMADQYADKPGGWGGAMALGLRNQANQDRYWGDRVDAQSGVGAMQPQYFNQAPRIAQFPSSWMQLFNQFGTPKDDPGYQWASQNRGASFDRNPGLPVFYQRGGGGGDDGGGYDVGKSHYTPTGADMGISNRTPWGGSPDAHNHSALDQGAIWDYIPNPYPKDWFGGKLGETMKAYPGPNSPWFHSDANQMIPTTNFPSGIREEGTIPTNGVGGGSPNNGQIEGIDYWNGPHELGTVANMMGYYDRQLRDFYAPRR